MDDNPITLLPIDTDEVAVNGLMSCLVKDKRFSLLTPIVRPPFRPLSVRAQAIVADPEVNGSFEGAVLAEAREHAREARIIVFTRRLDEGSLLRALEAPVHGYLLKGRPGSGEMVAEAAVQAVRHSVVTVDEAVRDFFAADPRRLRLASPPTPPKAMTKTEELVLRLLCEGLHDEEIAARLGVNINTARTHIHNIEAKLAARQRTEIGLLAVRYGLIDPFEELPRQ